MSCQCKKGNNRDTCMYMCKHAIIYYNVKSKRKSTVDQETFVVKNISQVAYNNENQNHTIANTDTGLLYLKMEGKFHMHNLDPCLAFK